MATITSAKSGLWSATDTWVGGSVPGNNDTVVIANGHTVEFDVNQSGFADGIAGITVTGTLKLTRTSGTYYLKMKAATVINIAGVCDFGTQNDPIPLTAIHTVSLNGVNTSCLSGTGGGSLTVYGTEPANLYARTTQSEAVGATRIEIDRNLTADSPWRVGDTIYIIRNTIAQNYEAKVISAIGADYIDITTGLASAKPASAYVVLVSRNVKISNTNGYIVQNFTLPNKVTLGGGEFYANYGVGSAAHYMTVSGGVLYFSSYAIRSCNNVTVSGGVFIGGYAAEYCYNLRITGGFFPYGNNIIGECTVSVTGGLFAASPNVFVDSIVNISGGTFDTINYFAYRSTINIAAGVSTPQFTNITYFVEGAGVTSINCEPAATTMIASSAYQPNWLALESINHAGVPGAFRSWTPGGTTTSVASPAPSGMVRAYQIALASATIQAHWRRRILVPAGKTVNITTYLRKSASMAYLPRAWVYEDGNEPFLDATSILHEFVMTDSVDTWETDTYSYTNTADYDKTIDVRFVGMNATGNVYTQLAAAFAGGLSRSRVLGGVG